MGWRLGCAFRRRATAKHNDNQVTQPIDYRVAKPLARVILLEVRAKEINMLLPEEKLRLLSMVDILEPLSQDEIKELSRRIPDTHYQQGQLLYTPKERSEALFMLKKGRVRIYRVGHDGREFTLTVVGAGTVFGEMSLTAQRLENAYAEAMERIIVCKMRKHDLERLVMDKPLVGLKLMGVLSERLSLAEDRMEDIALKEVPSRLAGFILQLVESEGVMTAEGPKIPTRYTHRQLATMIGSKRETVTKAFTLLQQAGAIELKRRRIHVRDIETLRKVADQGLRPMLVG